MLRIRFTAHIIHAPQASRSGGRRTLRDNVRLGTRGRARRDVGKRGRPLPPGWWVAGAVPFGLAFLAGAVLIFTARDGEWVMVILRADGSACPVAAGDAHDITLGSLM